MQMPAFGRMLMHCSVLEYDGNAYAFLGRSGTGKSTHTKLWLKYLSPTRVINGDKPILEYANGKFIAYGTPWMGKEGYGINEMLPLRGIAFVHRASENRAKRTSGTAAVFPFLTQVYLPEDEQSVLEITSLADAILGSVPLVDLYVNMEKDAAHVARRALIGEPQIS